MKTAVRIILSLFTAALMFFSSIGTVSAEESLESGQYSYVLMEGSTATLLYSDNGSAVFPAFHSAKLMTLLILAEAIDAGELSLDTVVKVSQNANSRQGAQIWLNVGEEIAIDELVMAITVGNANDAAVAIAEAVCKTEEAFVAKMNERAKELGMLQTVYTDPTGVYDGNVTTACDIAVLASELSHYDFLESYFTTWLTSVRGGRTELVSTNRLILGYSGITGMKAYYSEETGNCLIASAERNGITMICVILGEQDEYERFSTAREKMNIGFSAYEMYTPKRTDIYAKPVAVKKGVSSEVEVAVGSIGSFVIRKSEADSVEMEIEYYDDVTAPVYVGDEIGRVVFSVNGEARYSVPLLAAERVEKINIFSAALKLIRSVFS